jgi:hypothetical protein
MVVIVASGGMIGFKSNISIEAIAGQVRSTIAENETRKGYSSS